MKSACLVLGFALVGIACSTSPTANKQADASTRDADQPDAASSSVHPPVPACENETDRQACAQCCADAHNDGSTVYMDAVSTCMCEPAHCASECASTLCATRSTNADAACSSCFDTKQVDCGAAVNSACGASAACAVFNQCLTNAGCATKNTKK